MENQNLSQEDIVDKLKVSYTEEINKNSLLTDGLNLDKPEIRNLQIKLLQTSQQFARTFENPISKQTSLKGKTAFFVKKVIRKTTRFMLKPYADQMLKYQELLGEYLWQSLECFEKSQDEISSLKKTVIGEKRINNQLEVEIDKIKKHLTGEEIIPQFIELEKQDSYAQVGEDCIIDFVLQYIKDLKSFTYLDIGCNHYKILSNTYHFYKKGYKGVLIDANPEFIEDIKKNRPNDIVLNLGVGTKSGESLTFYVLNGDGLSSFNKEAVDKALQETSWLKIEKELLVPIITVDEIIEKYFEETPTVVSIDIEGSELEILNSIDLIKYRPLLFIIETISYSEKLDLDNKRIDIIDFMHSKGYYEYAFTGVNSIFIDKSAIKN